MVIVFIALLNFFVAIVVEAYLAVRRTLSTAGYAQSFIQDYMMVRMASAPSLMLLCSFLGDVHAIPFPLASLSTSNGAGSRAGTIIC